MTWTARLTAIVFLVGGSIHLVSFALLPLGIDVYGPTYPPLRHVLMASIDLSIGGLGMSRPTWLLFLLPGYVVQRLVFNPLGWEAIVAGLAWLVLVVESPTPD
jgi:hypothetical protein